MTPRSSKAKGMGFQSKIKGMLLKHFPSLQPDDLVTASAGQNGEDIKLSPAARKLIGHQIECKKKKAMAVYSDYEQAKGHGGHEPILFIEIDRKKPLIVVDAEFYLSLLARNGPHP